ncbi:MAG: hypothetical protein GXX96_38375 [Planctomycetaceae bacterium]|nr:hypothetical protein [Planctomycetaceae bacterium]
MPSMFKDPVGWTERAVGTTGRFVFLCTATLIFWGLAMIGVHLVVRESELCAVTGETLSAFHRSVWILVYVATFLGFVAMPLTYLTALHALLFAVRTKRSPNRHQD